mmetsp:Transcript_112952/g.364656  ORF Transcript_112952/g.364656 Transcript_112952/m.364656 type:complete len:242 (+) Transcript_112952:803-1528(+)
MFEAIRQHLTSFSTNSSCPPPAAAPMEPPRNHTPSLRPPRKPCISSTVGSLRPSRWESRAIVASLEGSKGPAPIGSSPASSPPFPERSSVEHGGPRETGAVVVAWLSSVAAAALRRPSVPVPMKIAGLATAAPAAATGPGVIAAARAAGAAWDLTAADTAGFWAAPSAGASVRLTAVAPPLLPPPRGCAVALRWGRLDGRSSRSVPSPPATIASGTGKERPVSQTVPLGGGVPRGGVSPRA